MESTSAWRTHKGAYRFATPQFVFCRSMDSTSAPAWEQQRRAPVRARGAEDDGGAPGPSTMKGKRRMDKKFLKWRVFPCRRTLGRAMRRKARRLALAEAPILFFSVVLCWQNFKSCECLLAMPSFQCIGGGNVPPPCLAGRWAGRRAKRRVAWPWRRRQIFFLCRIVLAKR